MGISDLRKIVDIREVPFDELNGSIVGVDFHNWIYRYLTVLVRFTDEDVYTTKDGAEVANLLGIVKGVPKFFENDLFPVFIFDGAVPDLKESEMTRRRNRKQEAAERRSEAEAAGDMELANRLKARTQRLTPTILDTSRELLDILDLPAIDAPQEAEAQAAYMAERGDIEYVGTEDYDSILFGAPLTLRGLTSSGDPEVMDLDATLQTHGIDRRGLIDIAILCGTDYNDGVHGVGPKTALKAVKNGESAEDVLDRFDTEIDHLEVIRELFLSPEVSSSYSFERTWDPDLDEASQFITESWGIPREAYAKALDRLMTVRPE